MNRIYNIRFKQSLFAIIAIYMVLFAGLYASTYAVMMRWWAKDDFSYCYLIPFIVIYLLWEKRSLLSEANATPEWKGLFLFLIGVGFYWIGELGGEYYIQYVSSWLLLVGICLLHMGWRKIKIILFPLSFILTMFPTPNFFNFRISLGLKIISSKIGVWIMQAYGMSAYREGNVIDLGHTKLQIVDACSGLRYLFPLIVLSILLSYFYKAGLWKKVIIVLSSIFFTIITNSLRIALTGVLADAWGSQAAEGFIHGIEGWIIFMITLGFFALEMWSLNLLFPEKAEQKGGNNNTPVRSDGNVKGFSGAPYGSGTLILKQPHFLVATSVLCITLIMTQTIAFREAIPMAESFDQFPIQLGKWTGTRRSLQQEFINSLDFSDYLLVDYQADDGKVINFYVAYYESQRKGESIHTPASCFRGGGWEVKQNSKIVLDITDGNDQKISVNRALLEKGPVKQLAYYWFPSRGRILTNVFQLKWYTFWDALVRHRTDGALVRIISSVDSHESLADTEARLQMFVKEAVPILSRYLPT